jgi:hypothetical protein
LPDRSSRPVRADHAEHFFETRILLASLVEVLLEARAKLRRGGHRDHQFKLFADLALGIINLLENTDEDRVE